MNQACAQSQIQMRNGRRIFQLLQQTLDEQSAANEELNELAEGIVNPEALLESEEFATSGSRALATDQISTMKFCRAFL